MQERIKTLRKTLGLTQKQFAEKIGVKQNTVAQYEIGRNIPTDMAINLICREFGVNEIWLRTGVGDLFQKKERSQEMTELFADLMNDRSESFRTRLITALLRFSPDGPEWAALESIYNSIQSEAEKKTDP
ncbi:MAG: helix-turn-helix transcriptional regulator [Anaerovoracaceae bacterium]|nr:helix-turn-helix transcriptional regulator [Anaerovoracaceae bacterium]